MVFSKQKMSDLEDELYDAGLRRGWIIPTRESEVAMVEDDQIKRALAHAKSINPETASVRTDDQGTWYGVKGDMPTTNFFEICEFCDEINRHDDECPEGYEPI